MQNSPHSRRLESEVPEFRQVLDNRHRRDTNPIGTDEKPCPKNKPIIKKAFTRCSTTSGCIVQCSNNHQFANGKNSAKMLCEAGVWMLEGFEKNDKPICERE